MRALEKRCRIQEILLELFCIVCFIKLLLLNTYGIHRIISETNHFSFFLYSVEFLLILFFLGITFWLAVIFGADATVLRKAEKLIAIKNSGSILTSKEEICIIIAHQIFNDYNLDISPIKSYFKNHF